METTNKSAEIAEQIASGKDALSWYARYKKEKRCCCCGENLPEGWPRSCCEDCLKKAREEKAQKRKARKENGCCIQCGAKLPEGWKGVMCSACKEKQKARRLRISKKISPLSSETSPSLLEMCSLNPMSNTQEGNMDSNNDQHEHESEQTAVLADSKPQAPEEADKQEATPVSISEQEGYHHAQDEAEIQLEKVGAMFKRLDKIQQDINEASNRLFELSKEKNEVMTSMSKLEAERKEVQDLIKINLK